MKTTDRMKKSQGFAHAINYFLSAAVLPILALSLTPSPSRAAGVDAVLVAGGFLNPLYVAAPPGDTKRLFVTEQQGKIKIINIPSGTVNPTPFLDLTFEVAQNQGEGILGMTFDPNYAVNGHFYVCYTTSSGGAFGVGVSHVARFTVSSDPDFTDPATEVTVITADQPETDHNWDWIGFSNRANDEGNLYICAGDGGGLEDKAPGHLPGGNAQSTQSLLGKILRIHIENDGSYTIPPNNPFFGSTQDKQEVWAYGLRNPFRASFDRQTGNMFIGDVGETLREEVDVNQSTNPGGGENYGWRLREGLIQNPRYANIPPPPNAVDPVLDYTHEDTGICVIGGYVYRGRSVRSLRGLYVFGDCFGSKNGTFTGRVFTLRYSRGTATNFTDITDDLFPTRVGGIAVGPITSFGEDPNGEIYITDLNGNVFKIVQGR